MITNKSDLKYYIEMDNKASNRKRKMPLPWNDLHKFHIILRKTEFYRNNSKNIYYKIKYLYFRYKYYRISKQLRFEIPLNCFGPGLSIAHGGPIIINSGCKIGKNCRIHSMVNIGTAAGKTSAAPIIGDDVYIGPGAKIYGLIKIGSGVLIGANSVVNKSFEENDITIAGVPAKKISNEGRYSKKI